ncbi:MAG TPA: glycosyltransferase [Saprospiraceae bacterium]|nr:glycosyltransferase [Saprospiraceae bacterium]HRO09182.1 glycosyltransferase [Saprospiraceae bacterium]HRP42524.1 glycosyltransferase [Saprospiraceae bacterium]
MLSIVIPVYNHDVRPLVTTLMKQCNKLDIPYQILCFDDGSQQKYRDLNKELAFRINVNYTELNENLGRSRIRNWLGKAAYYDYILFLDCDSIVKNRYFIKNYIDQLPISGIIHGGRSYQPKKPRAKKKILHWVYGTQRESLPAKKRMKAPYMNFHTNNFLIPESVFNNHQFDENVHGYGYEDLLYAFDLERKGIPIVHIDNPVIHDGLEVNDIFLNKTKNAIRNLVELYKSKRIVHTRLIHFYEWMQYYKLTRIFEKFYPKFEKRIEASLLSERPSMTGFMMWKLNYFIQCINK